MSISSRCAHCSPAHRSCPAATPQGQGTFDAYLPQKTYPRYFTAQGEQTSLACEPLAHRHVYMLTHAIGSEMDKWARTLLATRCVISTRRIRVGRLGSGQVRSDQVTPGQAHAPSPLHGLPAASTNAVCPACCSCRRGWPGEGGSLLPPQASCGGGARGRQGSPQD